MEQNGKGYLSTETATMAKATYSQLAKLFDRLATGYSAGLDIRKIVERESKSGSPAYRKNMARVYEQVASGGSLAKAMASTGDFFPELAIAVVQAGEKGGRLEQSFKRLAHYYQTLVKFRTSFLLSIAWPAFELFFAVFVIGMLILVMGWVCRTGNIEPIDWFGLGLSTMGNFILYWTLVLVIFGTAFFVILGIAKGWFGYLPIKIARRVPVIGKTIDYLSLSRFSWTLSVAENAGMNIVEAMRLAIRATQNYYYRRLEDEVCEALRNGVGVYKAMRRTGAFPEDLLVRVETGELAGELAEVMDRTSIEYQTQAENNLKLIGTIGFICTLLFVGLVIGILIITMYKTLVLDQYQKMLSVWLSDPLLIVDQIHGCFRQVQR